MNIDSSIIAFFLVTNLLAGFYYGQNVKNFREYAIGNRNFSTAALTATIIATWISGSFFAIRISETYRDGVWSIVSSIGQVVALLVTGRVLGPRMHGFLGTLSVAECMGLLYGRFVRIITSIAAIAQAIGFTAIQLKVFATIFTYFFDIEGTWATIISSFIVVTYSAFGGIKAVTFTDIIQFGTFGIFIPLFALLIWGSLGSFDQITEAFQTNPKLNIAQLVDINNPKFFPYLFLLFYYMFPALNPTVFQRILMAKNVHQVRKSFTNAALLCLILHLISCFIGITILVDNPNLNPSNLVMYIVDKYSFPGLKGITVVGIIAMVMSTADSWINTGAVVFTNDLLKSFNLSIQLKNELLFSRIFSAFVGLVAIILALSAPSLLKLVLLQANFYIPIVTIPLMLAIFGFRSSTRAILVGMVSGVAMVIIWRNFIQDLTGIESVMPAMLTNLCGILATHYLLGEPGGLGPHINFGYEQENK